MSEYVGTELELFKNAVNWKNYYGAMVAPFLRGDVAEVGAGIGVNTGLFCNRDHRSWVCLEPDPALAEQISAQIKRGALPAHCEVIAGTTEDLTGRSFDSIIYVDVLEHILDDKAEVARALSLLKPGGHLIVLSPAHQFLFSNFDAAIGHHRRYNKRQYREIVPARLITLRYLDSCGMLLSLANRVLLKQDYPTLKQILFWDRRVVPMSRVVDRLLNYRVGKSLLGVWQKQLHSSTEDRS